jgi:FG-GAP repeat/S-layer homology domain
MTVSLGRAAAYPPARRLPGRLAWVVVAVLLTISTVGGARLVAISTAGSGAPGALRDADDVLYAARTGDAGVSFANGGQQLSAQLTRAGTRVVTENGNVDLAFMGVGRELSFEAVVASGAASVAGNRVETLHRTESTLVSEWWVNDPSGLEQGFTIATRPDGGGDLRIQMALTGSLAPVVAAADTIAFVGSGLRYGGLAAWDADGLKLAPRFELDGTRLSIVVDDANAQYPLTIDPTFTQQAYVKASNTDSVDFFGNDVAIDGNTMVVGAHWEASNAPGVNGNEADDSLPKSGAAYVFVRTDGIWAQEAYLKASNPGGEDEFGWSVAVSGDTIVVGAPNEDSDSIGVNAAQNDLGDNTGAAYVFVRSGVTWSQQAFIKAANSGNDDEFGSSVAVSGDAIVIGAPFEDTNAVGVNQPPNDTSTDAGAAYVFARTGASWTQQAFLKASNTTVQDYFGGAVAIDGETVAVGANAASGDGAAYVFTRSGVTWAQQAYVTASNGDVGDRFGDSIDISGDALIVGAPLEDSNATGVNGNQTDNSLDFSGAAYVYSRSGTTWIQEAYLKASNTGDFDQFGNDVAIDRNVAVVGAGPEDSNGTGIGGNEADESAASAGAAYLFMRSGATWSQQSYVKSSNSEAGDLFGDAIAVDGDTIVVGAIGEDSSSVGVNQDQTGNTKNNAGAAYAIRVSPAFFAEGYLKASNTDANDKFGTSVAISGDTLVVGAPWEASGTGLQISNSAPASGAAYVFTRSGTTWSQQAYLKASNIDAGDNFGESVAISGDTIVVGAPFEDSNTDGVNTVPNSLAPTSGAAFVFTRSGSVWTEQAYLKASNSDAGDDFGESVAISGDTVVVGAGSEDSGANGINGNQGLNGAAEAGAAYVFGRSGSAWSQQAYLKASNSNAGDLFGTAVAISDNTIVVGARGEDSGLATNEADNSLGDAGAAYVFTRSAGTWSQQKYLKASNIDATDQFGWSVAIAGNTIAVGAYHEDSSETGVAGIGINDAAPNAGAAYVFHRSGSSWTQEAYLKASNTDANDEFGFSVAIGVDVIAVGARGESSDSTVINGDEADDSAGDAGAVYYFSRSDGAWDQDAYLKAANAESLDVVGTAVAISGATVVAGAPDEDSVATGVNGNMADNSRLSAGAAYVAVDEGCFAPPFSDVAIDHTFCREILWMADNAVSTGFDDGTYRPSIEVTRQAMSAFLARLANGALVPCTSQLFDDVPIDHPFCEEIQWMHDEGISTGFDDDTYRPSIAVTRQAMSAFMARLADADLTPCVVAPFTDVATSHPFCSEITWMKNSGVSTGFSDGTYRPSISVTRQAMSAFLYRVSVFVR